MNKEKFIKEYLPYIIIIIVILLIRAFIVTPIKVNGNSMYPTLQQNEIMILNKIGVRKSIKRWDIVVVKEEKKFIIKRVIALPGESVAYINGKLYINKKLVEDNYSLSKTIDFDEIYLGKEEYFVMGDNRSTSADSRIIGPVKREQIIGKTSLVVFPFNKVGTVK